MVNFRVARYLVLTGFTAVVALVPGCTKAPTGPSTYAAFAQTDLRVGTGAGAATGNVLTVHYTGWFYDASNAEGKGVQFETSVGGTPIRFVLGTGQVIAGWDRGLPGMQVGGLRRLVIPPSLAYGAVRNSVIPPNTTLVFEIELVQIGQTVTQ